MGSESLSPNEIESSTTVPAQRARKRRMAQRRASTTVTTSSREARAFRDTSDTESDGEEDDEGEDDHFEETGKRARVDGDASSSSSSRNDKSYSLLPGFKKQSRYVPGVPMTREELSKWRKEARRVRNRESAAESRRKTKERITELEQIVEQWESKYEQAMHRVAELEEKLSAFTKETQESSSEPETPKVTPYQPLFRSISPSSLSSHSAATSPTSSPQLYSLSTRVESIPCDAPVAASTTNFKPSPSPFHLNPQLLSSSRFMNQPSYQIKIPRPTAVCVE